MKKIIIVTRNMHGGGAERVIAQLANYFYDKGNICDIITINNEKVLYELNQQIKLTPIGEKSKNKLVDKILRYSELRKIILQASPDIVLSMPEDIGIYVILALRGTKIPVYVSERNNPWVMPDVKITRILRKMMYPFARGIIFQTEMAKSFFSKSIQKKGIVLGNPVDDRRIPQPFAGEREKVIVAAGRLDRQKNFPLLIRAFSMNAEKHPEYKLIIFGEGELKKELEELVEKLKLHDKVSLPGRKSDVLMKMRNAAMFVLSSDYEGLPNILIEAMCMGMPVISTDCPSGGPKQLIENEINGILVPVNDVEKMAQAIDRMTNAIYAEKLGNEAFKLRKKITSRQVFEEWESFLLKE